MKIVATGKTIEKAIDAGLQELGASLEDVEIIVLSEGGILKKAKVELTLITKKEEEKKPEPKKEKAPKEEKKALKESKKEIKKSTAKDVETEEQKNYKENKTALKPKSSENKFAKLEEKGSVNPKEVLAAAEKYMKSMVEAFNANAKVVSETKDGELYVKLEGDGLGVFIGYHGEAMEAIQVILNNVISNKLGRTPKIYLDVENYREKRIESLKDMATKLANKVKANKRNYRLEPMSSFERRVIHTALQDIEGVSSHSEGNEPNRFLVIDYKGD